MLLRLSDKYDFLEIRSHVICQLLTPQHQEVLTWQRSLELGTKYHAPQLVTTASVGLCLQPQPLDGEAINALATAFQDNEKVALLLQARERARDHLYGKAFTQPSISSCNNGCMSLSRISQHLKTILGDGATPGLEKDFASAVKTMFLKRDYSTGHHALRYNCAACKDQADSLVERVLNVTAVKELVQDLLPWCRTIRPLPRPAGPNVVSP